MHRFRDLRVFQFGCELVKDVYTMTRSFPKSEQFNLSSQIQRAAVSTLLNIGEGAGKHTDADFAKFLTIANGSANEVEVAAIIAFDQNYSTETQLEEISKKIESLNKMLFKFQEKLRSGKPNS